MVARKAAEFSSIARVQQKFSSIQRHDGPDLPDLVLIRVVFCHFAMEVAALAEQERHDAVWTPKLSS